MKRLHLTPVIMEAAYSLLRTTPPFNSWRLPEADSVEFHVQRTKRQYADHVLERGTHRIRLSHQRHYTLNTVLMSMAHEMCHMVDALNGVKSAHGASFQAMADKVCAIHGWDRGTF